jgi:hypothetical protein
MKKLLLIALLTSSVLFCSAQGLVTVGVLAGMELSNLKSKRKQAEECFKNRNFQCAFDLYTKLIMKDSSKTDYITRAGNCLYFLPGNGMQPALYYNRVLRVKPNDTSALSSMGILYKREAGYIEVKNHATAFEKDSLNEQAATYLSKSRANGSNIARAELLELAKIPIYQTTWTIEKEKEREKAAANELAAKAAVQDTINNPCLAIVKSADPKHPAFFTPQHSPYTDVTRNDKNLVWYHVIFGKRLENGKTIYTVFLYINSPGSIQDHQTVAIFFKDGTKIIKRPVKINRDRDVKNPGQYIISTTLTYGESDHELALLKASPIISIVLNENGYGLSTLKDESKKLHDLFLCLVDKKL